MTQATVSNAEEIVQAVGGNPAIALQVLDGLRNSAKALVDEGAKWEDVIGYVVFPDLQSSLMLVTAAQVTHLMAEVKEYAPPLVEWVEQVLRMPAGKDRFRVFIFKQSRTVTFELQRWIWD